MINAKTIDALLPQTQCGLCGFKGCLPYAEALVEKKAPIDRCPPGGLRTLTALGKVLNIDPEPYREVFEKKIPAKSIAKITEAECIGCTKCIQACPVDAILGSAKLMHVVLNHDCTGCGLCIEPCPVDCIQLESVDKLEYQADKARFRYQEKALRQNKIRTEKQDIYTEKSKLDPKTATDQDAKLEFILAAVKRVALKRSKNE